MTSQSQSVSIVVAAGLHLSLLPLGVISLTLVKTSRLFMLCKAATWMSVLQVTGTTRTYFHFFCRHRTCHYQQVVP
jgi:hypothetical protein